MDIIYFIVQQMMFFSIPLLIVALGGMFSERSGVVNIALEGIMVAGAFAGIFESFQFPAFSASISTMLNKAQFVRANAMLSLAESASGIVAPVLAGVLLPLISIGGIMTIDIVTFTLAVLAMLIVHIPQPKRSQEGAAARAGIWSEAVYGFGYIWRRPSLLGLQASFFFSNLFSSISIILLPAMILARTGGDEVALGIVQGALGAAGLAGGLLMATWGGPRRKIHGVLLGTALSFLLGDFLFAVGQGVVVWIVAAAASAVFIPILLGSRNAIWQAKVPPAVQGRVFATDSMLRLSLNPAGYLLAGVLADRLEALGYEVTRGVGVTGVVAVLANGDGPTVLLRADIDAQINHLIPGAFHHHPHQILADIMQVAFDGADNKHTAPLGGSGFKMRFKLVHTGRHRFGRHQQVRHKDFVTAEFFSHFIHPGHQSFGKDIVWVGPLLERIAYQFKNAVLPPHVRRIGRIGLDFSSYHAG